MNRIQILAAPVVAFALAAPPWEPGTASARAQSGAKPAQEPAQPGFDQEHSQWTEILRQHVRGDRFDYRALSENRGRFDQYLLQLGAVARDDFQGWSREQQYAFWINAYNAFTVHLILQEYPVESIKDIGGVFSSPWKKSFIPLGRLSPDGDQQELSLDDVEHAILRPKFKDARVHAAVNCASRGCPPLRNSAYTPERLDAELDETVRAWLADATRNQFEPDKNRVRVSQIFRWFEEDFVRDAGSVQAWLARYAPPPNAAWLAKAKSVEIDYLEYSWKLNDVERAKR